MATIFDVTNPESVEVLRNYLFLRLDQFARFQSCHLSTSKGILLYSSLVFLMEYTPLQAVLNVTKILERLTDEELCCLMILANFDRVPFYAPSTDPKEIIPEMPMLRYVTLLPKLTSAQREPILIELHNQISELIKFTAFYIPPWYTKGLDDYEDYIGKLEHRSNQLTRYPGLKQVPARVPPWLEGLPTWNPQMNSEVREAGLVKQWLGTFNDNNQKENDDVMDIDDENVTNINSSDLRKRSKVGVLQDIAFALNQCSENFIMSHGDIENCQLNKKYNT